MNTPKNVLLLVAIATTLSLASCQSQQVDPKPATAKKTAAVPPTLADDGDQPPKDTGKGGGN